MRDHREKHRDTDLGTAASVPCCWGSPCPACWSWCWCGYSGCSEAVLGARCHSCWGISARAGSDLAVAWSASVRMTQTEQTFYFNLLIAGHAIITVNPIPTDPHQKATWEPRESVIQEQIILHIIKTVYLQCQKWHILPLGSMALAESLKKFIHRSSKYDLLDSIFVYLLFWSSEDF